MLIINLTSIVFLCIIITRKSFSLEDDELETVNNIVMEPYLIRDSPSSINQYSPINFKMSPILNNRRSESAEKYFDWTRKNQRPVEFLRGKRFWLFAKKDESDANMDVLPNVKTQQNSLTQGLWRSGIVGRRR